MRRALTGEEDGVCGYIESDIREKVKRVKEVVSETVAAAKQQPPERQLKVGCQPAGRFSHQPPERRPCTATSSLPILHIGSLHARR
jgi:hypothetical protein